MNVCCQDLGRVGWWVMRGGGVLRGVSGGGAGGGGAGAGVVWGRGGGADGARGGLDS